MRISDWSSDVCSSDLMGMGEPLYNYENVATAMRIAMDQEGLSISKRKITLSTSGVVPEMARCGRELDVNLAVSLHATTDEVRDRIMPRNKKYPLARLMEACRSYPGTHNETGRTHICHPATNAQRVSRLLP